MRCGCTLCVRANRAEPAPAGGRCCGGQSAWILFGLSFIAPASLLWIGQPAPASSVVAGVLVQAYGVPTIVVAGVALARIGDIGRATRIGGAGPLATWWFHRWARRTERAESGHRMDDGPAAGSLRRALARSDELRGSEQE